MIQITNIDKNIDCCGQISVDDISTLKKNGYSLVVCARYDGEEAQQITSSELEVIFTKENIDFVYIPFRNHLVDPEQARQFYDFCRKKILHTKTLAFCRTGSRILCAWEHYAQN